MRKIKFRAWDKSNQKIVNEGDVTSWHSEQLTSGDLLNWFENEDLMQFTGLLDKNGKEIYESDLVKIDHHWSEGWEKRPHEVTYDNGSFYPWGTGDWEESSDKYEIVGNVYENKELLK